ncbi:hypothetical protein ACF07Z_28590 [Streptomyces albidoflavus]
MPHPREIAELDALRLTECPLAFGHAWVRREAYFKALDTGLSRGTAADYLAPRYLPARRERRPSPGLPLLVGTCDLFLMAKQLRRAPGSGSPLRLHPVRTAPLRPQRRPAAQSERMGRHSQPSPRRPARRDLAGGHPSWRSRRTQTLDEDEAARQKRIRWEAAMAEACIQYAEAYRVRHFEAQKAAWRHATRLTEYVSAVRTRVDVMPPGQTRTEAEAWIDWAAAHVERLDPLNTPPQLPDVPEPQADDLRPFLGHWSPYGP